MISERRLAKAIDDLFTKLVATRSPKAPGGERRTRFFPLGAEADAESYWQVRDRKTFAPEDFDALGSSTAEELGDRLIELWQDAEFPELESIVRELTRLSESLRINEEQQDEVSAFIYVMY